MAGACQGDLGSALVSQSAAGVVTLVGVVSIHRKECAVLPEVFAEVGNP